MKHLSINARRHRQSGAALITALLVAIATAMLLAASLAVSMTATGLGWNQVYSQAALQLADAGVNSELQFIAENVGSATTTGRSSQPVAYSGVTAELPGTSSIVLGRPGTVTGYTGGTFYVYSSNNASGSIAWDGVTSPFYITCSACVNNVWQTVQVQSTANSVFNVYGIFTTGTTSSTSSSSSNSITVDSGSTASITGPAGTNGGVSVGSGGSITAPTGINANSGGCTTNRLTTSNVTSGGQLCSVTPPLCYPRTADCCKKVFGCGDSATDTTCFSTCSNNCSNSSGIYQYNNWNGWTSSTTISSSTCCPLSGGCGNVLNANSFTNANYRPDCLYNYYYQGGSWNYNFTPVQTLIFEPGDYYFTSCQLQYYAGCDMVIDSQACASGGTPGQVRFWIYDPTGTVTSDTCQLPIRYTCASGQSTPDPGLFRIYYGKCGGTLNFQRPSNCRDWQGNTITGDFNYYCGIYACCNPATTTSTSCSATTSTTTPPCTVHFTGCSTKSQGCCNLCGSMLCDQLHCSGCCNCKYTASQTCTKDPCCGGTISGFSCLRQ